MDSMKVEEMRIDEDSQGEASFKQEIAECNE